MKHFQDLGHRVVFIVGDFTAMIGDPTGRSLTRPQLTPEEVASHAETYKKQLFRILDRDRTVVDYNSRWLDKLGSNGLVRLAGRYTLARMMEREDFRSRYESNQAISLHELLYPLVQAYDSIALEADVELGGHDQIFNLLVGRDLMKEEGLEPQVVLTVPLLVGTDGVEKMSKSLGNAIAVEDSASEIFGKTMSIPDELMWDWYLLLTELSDSEIEERRRAVAAGDLHPKRVKQELATRLTADFHGEEAAARVAAEFDKVFAAGGLPEDIPQHTLEGPLVLPRHTHQDRPRCQQQRGSPAHPAGCRDHRRRAQLGSVHRAHSTAGALRLQGRQASFRQDPDFLKRDCSLAEGAAKAPVAVH